VGITHSTASLESLLGHVFTHIEYLKALIASPDSIAEISGAGQYKYG
jgi:hypothetical protein